MKALLAKGHAPIFFYSIPIFIGFNLEVSI